MVRGVKGNILMLKSRSCLCLMFCLLLSYDLVYIQFLCTLGFVPLLCSIVLIVLSCITLSTLTLVP